MEVSLEDALPHVKNHLSISSSNGFSHHIISISSALSLSAEFDSSYKRGQPLTFAPNQVIKG
jgi:hypothetical protein